MPTIPRRPAAQQERDRLRARWLRATELFAAGVHQAEVARQLGVSAQATSVWHTRWKAGGTGGLHSRGPSGRAAPPAPCAQTPASGPRPRRRTASAGRRRTGRPPPGHRSPQGAAAPSPRPESTAGPSGARAGRTGQRIARRETAGPAHGVAAGKSTAPAARPHSAPPLHFPGLPWRSTRPSVIPDLHHRITSV
jgi:hypothetical protein